MKYLIPFIFLLTACNSKNIPVSTEYILKDTTIFKDRQIPILIEGSAVNLNMDSVFKAWTIAYGQPPVNRTIVKTDEKLQTKLTLFLDSLGRVYDARCETLDQEYKAIVQDKERTITEQQKVIERQKETFLQEIGNIIKGVIGGAIFLVLLGIVLYILKVRMK